jgi:dihydroorotase
MDRRWKGLALPAAVCFSAASLAGGARAQAPHYDLLLKGGHVIDPANDIDGVTDVAIVGDKIAAVQQNIPPNQAGKVVDVSGLYVTPGLIDIHVHIGHGGAPLDWFAPFARSREAPIGIPPDLNLTSGVTTVVDAGSAGAETFLQEKEEVIDHSQIRVLAWLNIVANGMEGGLEQSLDEMNPKKCAATIRKHRDIIVGVKTAHYWTVKPWDAEHVPWAAVDRAEECAQLAGVPVMVDFFPRPPERPYSDLILKKLRSGDIHTHVFAQQFPVILPDGKLNPIMLDARKRGVIFDVGHGSASFWWRNAAPAIQQGFMPDSISTDIHEGNLNQFVVGFDHVASKFLAMGESIQDVIRQSTVNPAREIRRPDLGTLSVGSVADVAVLQVLHGRYSYSDCGFARLDGTQKLIGRMTVRAGAIVYDPSGLSMVEWHKAREQYFFTPTNQGMRRATADDFPRRVTKKK